jgi:formate hydrogenlyase transcriptional activator
MAKEIRDTADHDIILQYQALLDVLETVVTHHDLQSLFRELSKKLQRVIHFDLISVVLHDQETGMMRILLGKTSIPLMTSVPEYMTVEDAPGGWVWQHQEPLMLDDIENETRFPETVNILRAHGVKTCYVLPLTSAARRLGAFGVGSLRESAYGEADLALLRQVAKQVAIAVDNALAFREIESLKNKLAEEKLYLEEEIQTAYNFEQVIGQSAALTRILRQVETVAPTDSTILILGETGTGKEVIAHSIHSLSERRDRTLVKLNCAAIPTGLLESELFGHERGAFTGAIAQRIGRFELAHRGTLFLDEVGDIPLDLQPKLLRVLQEKEFERLGSSRTIRVDVRLIAATNSDLAQMVAERKFRSDLFYRLNVFPIRIPPLRERPEDIPLLVRFFAQRFARRMKKRIETIPSDAVAAMTEYRWPGNIRELENFIERAVILSKGPELEIQLGELNTSRKLPVSARAASESGLATLEDAERDHIIKVLKQTDWVIGGQQGAAARLGMKRTTLQSRMRKLGIIRQD